VPLRGRLRDEAFSSATGERVPSFRVLSVGETAASPKGGMRRGQNSPIDKSQKRPARSLGAEEKASSLSLIIQQITILLSPASVVKTESPSAFQCSVHQLGDVHDLEGHLVSFHIGGHGSDALLAGRHHGLGAGTQDFLDLSLGNFR
jgi:hypothetical protein